MNDVAFVHWLKAQGLFHYVEKYYPAFKNIFSDCLKLKKEHVLVVFDEGYPTRRCAAILAGCYVLAMKRLGITFQLVKQTPKFAGEPADNLTVDKMFNIPGGNILILCLSGKLGSMKHLGKSFRKYIADKKHRFVSTSGLRDLETKYFTQLVQSIDVDYKDIQERGRLLKAKIDYADEMHILTDKGTNLRIDIKGKQAISNDGNYAVKGGNIPSGEVYLAPRGKHVEGRIVIDGTIRHREGTTLVKKPVVLTVKGGEVVEIKGGEEAQLLERTFQEVESRAKYPWGIRRVGEIGIGINKGASLIPVTIVSEKTLGTAHVGIGSNAWFGGTVYAISHFDQVYKKPRIYLDKKLIEY
tara:strand:+ start:3557 stop:4621 length:1065 start_codon:yes stop_codon:yes gene_type:complete